MEDKYPAIDFPAADIPKFIHAVCTEEHDEVARCISSGGANPALKHDVGGLSALHHAALRGHVRVAEVLLDRGWDLEARNDAGMRPLHCAIEDAHLQMIQFLVRRER